MRSTNIIDDGTAEGDSNSLPKACIDSSCFLPPIIKTSPSPDAASIDDNSPIYRQLQKMIGTTHNHNNNNTGSGSHRLLGLPEIDTSRKCSFPASVTGTGCDVGDDGSSGAGSIRHRASSMDSMSSGSSSLKLPGISPTQSLLGVGGKAQQAQEKRDYAALDPDASRKRSKLKNHVRERLLNVNQYSPDPYHSAPYTTPKLHGTLLPLQYVQYDKTSKPKKKRAAKQRAAGESTTHTEQDVAMETAPCPFSTSSLPPHHPHVPTTHAQLTLVQSDASCAATSTAQCVTSSDGVTTSRVKDRQSGVQGICRDETFTTSDREVSR